MIPETVVTTREWWRCAGSDHAADGSGTGGRVGEGGEDVTAYLAVDRAGGPGRRRYRSQPQSAPVAEEGVTVASPKSPGARQPAFTRPGADPSPQKTGGGDRAFCARGARISV